MNNHGWVARTIAGGAALALGLTMAGCSGGSGASSRPENELHVAMYGDAGNVVEQKMIDAFNATSEVKIVLDKIPGGEYQSKLQTIMDTPTAPDIFFNWGGGSIKSFVDADLVLPLDDFIKEDPQLKDAFLPSVFETAVIDGKSYGVPMRGTQPVMLFNNSKVLTDAGISNPPATWEELLEDVKILKDKGITPIALGAGDRWPTLMWFEYLYDRVAGEGLFQKALEGDSSVWESEESRKALGMLRELVDAGAFGTNFDSVKFTDGGSPALLASGKAGFELMGSWEYSTQQSNDAAFAAEVLGYSEFPKIDGGKGDEDNLVGNTNNFYSIHKNTRYPETARDFLKLMYSDQFVQEQVAIGNLPTTTNTEKFLDKAADPEYAKYQFSLVKEAPSFQLSWDQAYPPEATVTILTAVSQFFSGQIDEDGFIKAMQSL